MVIMISLAPRGAPYQLSMLVLLSLPACAIPAEWTVTPSVRLRESYSDNMNLAPPAQARGEFTTEVSPGIAVSTSGPRFKLSLDYSLQKIAYTHQADRTTQQLDASGHADVLREWLYLDARSSISQQNISAFGPQLLDPAQVTGNNSTVRATSVSPYLKHYFHGLATAQLRYDYQRVSSGRLLNVHSDDTSLQLTGDNGGQGWNWDLRANRKNIDDSTLPKVTMSDVALTLSYPVNSRLSLFATDGYEKNDYHSSGAQPQGRHWSLGGTWTPSPRTKLAVSVGRRYFGNTYSLDAEYRLRSMYWTLNYNEDITTTHGEFLSIPPTGLGDFLYQLWATRIPDPQTRLQTVKLFLLVSQILGPNGNVNFFSHRYYLQKDLKLATVYSGPRSALAFSLSSSRRTAQTSNAIDSPLLGPDQLALEDRTRQNTAQAGWNYRMSPRSNLTVATSLSRAESLSTGRTDHNGALTVSLNHQLQPKVSASIDLRHVRHSSNAGGNYRENGIGAALMVAF
ncbi:TIGR03016 family PEP-CTERM system-associated outer membrane protein [Duganella sp. BJB475]|nr:TIGR03016 family PEP-CTERM system-associated outer membrane protein [Duganella sp. BJB475]RFP36082.1 TIGR03016 family PEP-CTERM system-associated outer membrane protein [Duganella sp. BJB476]